MISHRTIDERGLSLAEEIVRRVDADPQHNAVTYAQELCQRWLRSVRSEDVRTWSIILSGPWPEIRRALLDPSENGNRLRQSNPFCGVLSPQERWRIYRRFRHHDSSST